MILPRQTRAAGPSRAALTGLVLVLIGVAGFAQDDYPVEVSGVELRNGDTSGSVTLRTESAVEWSVDLAERQLVLFMPRAVPGPEALDRSSRAGLISLVEVGFAVPNSVPTTRITVHLREAFEHSVERVASGLAVRFRATEKARQEVAAPAAESGSSGAEVDRLRDENEQLKQRVTELHDDRLELRNSLQSARAELRDRESAQEAAAAAAADEESSRLAARNEELEAELASARAGSESLQRQLAQLESQLASIPEESPAEELSARIDQAEARERDLTRSLRRSQEAERTLRRWLSRAPSVLGASELVVAEGEGCLRVLPEPDPAGVELGCLAPGSSVTALSFRPDWLRVRGSDGKEGWVRSARLAPAQARNARELAAARRELEQAREREESLKGQLRTARAGADLGGPVVSSQADPCLTLRESPRTDSPRRDCLEPGTGLSIVDVQGDWLSVTVGEGGVAGWVAKRFVTSASARDTSDRIASLEADRQAMEARVATLADELEAARADADSKAAEVAELNARLSSADQIADASRAELEAEVALKTAELAASSERLAALDRDSGARVSELEAEAARRDGEIASLRTERERAGREAAQRTAALEDEVARKSAELGELNSRLESAEQGWQARLAELEAQVDRERTEAFAAFGPGRVVIKEETDPCLSFRDEPRVDAQSLDCLEPGIEAQSVSMAGDWLRLRLDDGREGWSSASFLEPSSEVELRRSRQSELEETEGLRAALAEARAQLATGRSANEDLLLQVAASRTANDDLRSRVAELEAARAELETTTADLAASRKTNEDLLSRVAALEGAQAKLETATAELTTSRSANEDLRSRVGELEAARAELETTSADLAAARSANEDLRSQLAELETALEEAVQAATAEAEAEPEGPSEEVLALKADLEASRSELARAREESSDLSDRMTRLQADLERAQDELASTRASHEALSEQVAALETKREELESVVSQATNLQAVEPPLPEEGGSEPSQTELALQKDLRDSRTALAEAEARGVDLERRLASLEKQLLDVSAELAASRANNEGLAGEVASLKTLSRELREALEAAVAPSTTEPLEPLAPVEIAESDLPATGSSTIEVSDAPPVPADLEAFAGAWARAWSGQRVDDYLSFYASTFVPADGLSRAEWEALRRQRLTAPSFIEVELSDFRIRIDGATRAMVAFEQRYQSNTFEDRVVKTLELVREDDLWKILSEVAE